MALKKPIVAYIAEGNAEAHAVVNLLTSKGIESHVVEDNTGVSLGSLGGGSSPFNRPEIWVEREHLEQAKQLLKEYEDIRWSRRVQLDNLPPITATCEKCDATSEFPASQDGSTQNCPECGAFIDVGEFEWEEEESDTSSRESVPNTVSAEEPLDEDEDDEANGDSLEDSILFVYAGIVISVVAAGFVFVTSPLRFVVLMMFLGSFAVLVAIIVFLMWCFSRGADEHIASYLDTDDVDAPETMDENLI